MYSDTTVSPSFMPRVRLHSVTLLFLKFSKVGKNTESQAETNRLQTGRLASTDEAAVCAVSALTQ